LEKSNSKDARNRLVGGPARGPPEQPVSRPNPDGHRPPACSVDGDCSLTRFALAVVSTVDFYPLFRMTPSPTTSQLRFSTRTQVCLPYTPPFYSGLRIGVCAAPHIGHLYTLVTADIFARYNRLANPNRPLQFVTGTDEHGLKIQRAAHGASRDPQVFCDRLSVEFRVCLSLPYRLCLT
jgi:hypothetical protein